MTQAPKNDTASDLSNNIGLNQVIVKNSRKANECILFPKNVPDDELQTKWILAREGSYINQKTLSSPPVLSELRERRTNMRTVV